MATKAKSTASKAKSPRKTKSTAVKPKSKSTKPTSASRKTTTRSTAKKKTTAKKPAAKKKPATKTTVKKSTAKKPAVKKTATKKPAAKKTTAKKPVAKKPVAKKTTAKKPAAKKPATKKPAAKKTTTQKPATRKAASKGSVVRLKGKNALDIQQLNFEPYPITKGEDYMNTSQIEHFEHILYGWKHALMEQVDQTVTHLKDEPGNLADPSDRATQEEEFNLELRTRDRERKLISKIDTALTQLKSSDYGYCTQCGEEIGIRRLEARPTASLCIDCKTLAEIREKHYSG